MQQLQDLQDILRVSSFYRARCGVHLLCPAGGNVKYVMSTGQGYLGMTDIRAGVLAHSVMSLTSWHPETLPPIDIIPCQGASRTSLDVATDGHSTHISLNPVTCTIPYVPGRHPGRPPGTTQLPLNVIIMRIITLELMLLHNWLDSRSLATRHQIVWQPDKYAIMGNKTNYAAFNHF